MIAAIYARKSTEQNGVADEAKSITRQVDHARAFAAANGWTVDPAFVFEDDGVSGAEFARRPGFLRLMNALKPRAPFQVLIMSEISRLGREMIETAYALKELSQAGVRAFSYLEQKELLLETATDKFLMSAVTFAAELERDKSRQRTYDAMVRKARAGHVTGGRVFGYENLDVPGPGGKRAHVERRVNQREAAVVRRMFEMCAAGQGVRSIAKQLNADGEPAPRAQQGRPVAWSPSTVWEALRRPLYRGELVWNRTRKRDKWGQQKQKARPDGEHLRMPAPELRIVSEALWQAAHARLDGARQAYERWNAGRAFGRPVNGTESKYLLTGLAQCGLCGGGLFIHTRQHGGHRAHFYGCSTFYHRGSTVCGNSQVLPMGRIDAAVLGAFQQDLLNPVVLGRAIDKLADRLRHQPRAAAERGGALTAEAERLRAELSRLTNDIATGAAQWSPVVLAAIRERENRRQVIADELAGLRDDGAAMADGLQAVLPEVRKRMDDWRSILTEETGQARQMLRTLLTGRLVFTPRPGERAVEFTGRGDFGQLFAGLVDSQALASPAGTGRLWCWDISRVVSLAA